jgi:hypothetical protein
LFPFPTAAVETKKVTHYTVFQKIGPGSYLEPVDVDAYTVSVVRCHTFGTERTIQTVSNITFKPKAVAERVSGADVLLYPALPSEQPITWRPEFHVG